MDNSIEFKTKINELINENKNLKSEISNLKKIISELENKNNNQKNQYEKDIKKLSNENNQLMNKPENIGENNKVDKINIDYKKYDMIFSLMEKLDKKEKIINKIKKVIPFDIDEEDELLKVIIVTEDHKVNYSLICKNTEKFNTIVENRVYDAYPEYKEKENYFKVNGNKINKAKTLDENKIKNNDVIMMVTSELK